MRRIIRHALRWALLAAGGFCLLFFAADLWFEFFGFPGWVQAAIGRRIGSLSPVDCRISWIRGGIFSGMRFEQVQLQGASGGSRFTCSLPQVTCSFDLFPLLRSRLRLNALDLDGLTATYQLSPETPALAFENGRLDLRRSRNHTLNLRMDVETEGIRLQGRCDLENFTLPDLKDALRRLAERFALPDSPAPPEGRLALLIERLHAYQFGYDDAGIDFTLQGDLREPDGLRVQGHFSVNAALLDNVTINKCRGRFSLRDHLAELADLHLIFGHGEMLRGEASVDLRKRTIAASCQGDVTPSVVLRYAGLQASSLPNQLTFHSPLHVKAAIAETPWDMRQARLDAAIDFRNIDVLATNIHHGHLDLACTARTLALENILVAGDFYGQDRITGGIRYQLDKRLLSGRLEGDLALLRILAENNVDLKRLSPLQLEKKHRLELELKPSPLDPAALDLKGRVRLADLKIRGRNFSGYEIPFRMRRGRLTVDQAVLALPDGRNAAELFCQLDLPRLLEKGLDAVKVRLRLFAFSPQLAWEPAMELAADLHLNLGKAALSLSDGQGRIHLSRLYSTYVTILDLPRDEVLALIDEGKSPAVFTCSVPEFSLKSPQDIMVEGQAHARGSRFNHLAIHEASADFRLTPGRLCFRNIRGLVDDQERLELDLEARLRPFTVRIENGRVHGRPNLIGNFIFDARAREIYQAVWKDVRWDAGAPPSFRLDRFLYSESDDDLSWRLELQGSAHIPNARIYGCPFPGIDAGIRLDLPETLEVSPVAVTTEDGRIEGGCRMLFDNEARCHFTVDGRSGSVDVLRLLTAIRPGWDRGLPDLRLPRKPKFSCQGSFNLDPGNPAVRLAGTFDIPELGHRGLRAEKLSGTWNFQNQKLFWDIREAALNQGRLRCSGIFDRAAKTGESRFELTGIPLQELLRIAEETRRGPRPLAEAPAPREIHQGRVDSSGKLRFFSGWAGRPLLLEGDAHVAVREGDLWKVPILSSLGRLVAMGSFHLFSKDDFSSLGTIRELDADVEFRGERLLVPKLYTDGTLIALNGSGECHLPSRQLKFSIYGEAMKSVNVLAFFLKPLSWFFQAELSGTAEEPKWRIRTPLRRIFSAE